MKTTHSSGQKLLSVLLVLLLLLSMVPVSAFAAENRQFALFALNDKEQIIEPCLVPYQDGQTLKDALKASGHTFTGIDGSFITAIDGKEGSYSLFYKGGKFDLSAPASEAEALWFTTNGSQDYSDNLLETVKVMAAFRTSTNGLKDYPAAKAAYDAALKGFYTADDTSAAKLAGDLKGAIKRYEDFLGGKTVSVKLNVTLDSKPVTADHVELKGEFGNVVKKDKADTVDLVPGTYTYDITHDSFRHATGTLNVTGPDVTLTAKLPTGQWIKDVQVGIDSGWTEEGQMVRTDVSAGGATFRIPDYAGGRLYAYIEPGEGVDTNDIQIYAPHPEEARSWKSKTAVTENAYTPNTLEGSVLRYEARSKSSPDMYQSYTAKLVRTPSLKALKVVSNGTALPLAFKQNTLTYNLSTTGDSVEITPTALIPDARITVKKSAQDAGQNVASGTSVTLKLAECEQKDGSFHAYVHLETQEKLSTEYHLVFKQTAAANVTVRHEAGTKVEIFTSAGAAVQPSSSSDTQSVYALVPDETYQCISTADTYFHAKAQFTAKDKLSFDAPAVLREDWLTDLTVKPGSSASTPAFPSEPAFTPGTHAYTLTADSNTSFFTVQPTAKDADLTIYADYRTHVNTKSNGRPTHTKLTSGKATNLTEALSPSGYGNDVTLVLEKKADASGKPYTDYVVYQDYRLHAKRQLTLNDMRLTDKNGTALSLKQKDAPDKTKFDKSVTGYTVEVGQQVSELLISQRPSSVYISDHAYTVSAACDNWNHKISYSSDLLPKDYQTITVPLDTSKATQTVQITASHADPESVPVTYTIEVTKLPAVSATITADPADAVVFLKDNSLKARVLPEKDGTFTLNTGISYTYYVTKNGYIGKSETFTAGQDAASISVQLEKAPEHPLTDLTKPGDWHQFRADNNNNGVVNVKTPIKAEDTVLVWANKMGEGFSGGAVGCPIIVGGDIYTYAGKKIMRVDKETGEILASGDMAAGSSFAINSPTYAEGMIFVGLGGGRVQAFDAKSLKSLWLYTDANKGQPNCPIAYADGYIYTGFWNSETKKANFICLSVTDEDPEKTDETKLPTWTHTDKGFYWSGAYVGKNFMLVPTDDGESGYTIGHGDLLSLDPRDGHVIDLLTMPGVGDLRSSICYDEATNAYYFTSKGGDFYQVKVNADGTFVKGSLRQLHLQNGSQDASNPPMSTSTPVIYKGRAYLGVSGTSQFGQFSGHNMTVIDLNSFTVAYTIPTQGYPQVSGLLTTAYEDTGYIYVYFIDNFTPGKLRVIRDQPGRTSPDPEYLTKETYSSGGKDFTVDAGYVLFTPSGDQAQYAICSPIVDAEGNLYFKNDSAQMMRLSSVITSLEVTKQPQKLQYEVGQTFDGAGLAVTAHYANGTSRDISQYLSFTSDPLTADDTEITISYDLDKLLHGKEKHWQLYQDKDGKPGTAYDLPTTSVSIQVSADHSWDQGVVQTESTCTTPGTILYTCTVCGKTKTEALPLAAHKLTHMDAKDATCTEEGTLEHYHCTVCQKNFADEKGTQELDTVTVPVKGHSMTHVDAQAPTCTKDGVLAHYHCSVCQKNFADEKGTQELTSVADPAKGHGKTEIRDAKDATCTEEGYTGDTYCTVCNEKIAEGKVIPALGHGKTEIRNAKDATATEDGYTGDTYCTVCGEKIAEGKVIPATGTPAPEPTEPEATQPDTTAPETSEPHTETPDASKPDMTKPVAPKPQTPATGDMTPIWVLSAAAAVSLLAAALLLTRKKKPTA